jgi:hypothetical protein
MEPGLASELSVTAARGALFASVALEAPVNLGAGEVVLWVSLGAKKLCIFSRHLDFNHV